MFISQQLSERINTNSISSIIKQQI